MIAVGLWGAQLGAPAIWLLPVTFPMVMAVGGFIGLVGIPLPGVEIGIALSALLLGLMVASEAKPSLAIAATIVAFFAIFHGHAHGTKLPAGRAEWARRTASGLWLTLAVSTSGASPSASRTRAPSAGLRSGLLEPSWRSRDGGFFGGHSNDGPGHDSEARPRRSARPSVSWGSAA